MSLSASTNKPPRSHSLASKLSSSIFLISLLGVFTISSLLFYVHHSPVATTQFYNFTSNALIEQNSYFLEKPSYHEFADSQQQNEASSLLSYSILNRFKDKNKSTRQHTIVLLSSLSRHFSHPKEKIYARKYNIQWIHVDMPGLGHSSGTGEEGLAPEALGSLLRKLKVTEFSIFAQGMASPDALRLAKYFKQQQNSLNLQLQQMVLFSPWIAPQLDADWNHMAPGHHTLISLFNKSPLLTEYLIKILSQFGFVTRSEYWYSNLDRFISHSDAELLRSSLWQPVVNNSMVELFRQGVGPFLKHYQRSLSASDIPSVQVPIDIFHSSQDSTVPFVHSKRLTGALSQAKLHKIEGDQHFGVFDSQFEVALRDVLHLKEVSEDERPQVFIVGGGLAGLSAAIEAQARGAVVTLLEKEDRVNGNSAKASSGINGVLTKAQLAANITDSYELFYNETMASGKGAASSALVDALVKDSTSAIEFFESRGINMGVLSALGGHSVPRTHRPKLPDEGRPRNAGSDIMYNLFQVVQKNPDIHIITKARATELIKENNRIVGVKYTHEGETKQLLGGPVVLATGGYSADREGFLKEHFSKYADIPTSNGAFATGDGIRLAQEVGAGLKHMNYVQIHPTCFLDPKDLKAEDKSLILVAEALRAYGAIMVNHKAHRFCNEIGLRDDTSKAIFQHCKPAVPGGPTRAYLLMNDHIIDTFGRKMFGFYQHVRGLVKKYDNFDAFVNEEGLSGKKLKRTVNMYNRYKDEGKDPFKKPRFPTAFGWNDPVYVAHITPCIHYSMGGLSFSKSSQVLTPKGKPVFNLYAAGEVGGGLHGKNRLGGNSLLECVVFGRRAGRLSVENQYVSGSSSRRAL